MGPLEVDEIFVVTLWNCPPVVPVTVTLKVHVLPAASAGVVDRLMVLVAAVVVRLFVPPQTEAVLSTTDRPVGNTSEKEMPLRERLSGAPFGFVIVKVNVDVLP